MGTSSGDQPEWARPEFVVDPAGRVAIPVGEPVDISFVLATSATAKVSVQDIVAFPTGFELQVRSEYVVRADLWDPMQGLAGLSGRPGDQEGALSDEHIRFRIQFSDGSEANNFGPSTSKPTKPGPYLQYWSGKGEHGRGIGEWARTEATLWVWPIPPVGPLGFACEWPAHAINLTRHEVDATLIREASRRATDSWPDEGGA
jgi:hypothetical protein